MRTAAVLCLVLYFRVGISMPLSNEDVSKQTEEAVQSESPVSLLLVVPPTSSQLRDDEEGTKDEDLSFIEDQIANLLFRDAETPIHEDHGKMVQNDASVVFAEDWKALNPLLRSGEDVEVNIVVEEPLVLNEDSDIIPELREDNKDLKEVLTEGPLPSKDANVNSLEHAEDQARLVPEESVSSTEGAALTLHEDSLPEKKLPLERSYEASEYATYKPAPKPVEEVVATYEEVPNSAVPILLNCSPNVVKGHLGAAAATPSYRSLESDLDVKPEVTNSHVLDMNSPASIISRKKRHEIGVTHYKVSEDYPDTIKGNHHLVSADYPTPNMVRITPHHEFN